METPETPLPHTNEADQSEAEPQPTAQSWRSRRMAAELTLPSGNVCLVRNPGIDHFLRTGIIPNQLRGIITQAMQGKKKELKVEELIQKEEDIDMIFDLFDNILLEVVVEPKVAPIPRDDEDEIVPLKDRDQNFIYPDEVDMNDKVFIFQFAVGGTRDLERFRREQEQSMAALQSGEGIQLSSQPAASD